MAKSISIPITGNAAPLRKVLDDTESRLSGFGSKVQGVFKGLAGVGTVVVGAAAAAGGALVALGNQFDSLENTIVKGTGASGDALDGLMQSTKDVLATVPDSGEVVATAIADVNTFFGQTGEQLETTTGQFLDFARVTGVDVSKAIGSVDAVLTQFGESAENTDELLGDFTRIAQATGAPMDQLLGQMETFGPLFANAGFSAEETAAMLGQLEQAGVSVTRVGPALNKFFRDAASEGEDPRRALEDMVVAIQETESSTEKLAMAQEAFGAEGAQRLLNAIESGNFALDDFNGLLGDGAGLVEDQADATETLTDKFNKLKNRALVALAPVAERVFGAVMSAMDAILPVVDRLSAAFDTGGIGGVFRELGDIAREVWPSVQRALGDFLSAFGNWVVNTGLPFVVEKLSELGQALVDWIGPRIRPMLSALGDFIARAANWVVNDGLPMLVNKLIELGDALVAWIQPNIRPMLQKLGELLISIGDWVLTTAIPKLLELGVKLGASLIQWVAKLAPDILVGLGQLLLDLGTWVVTEGIPKLFGIGADLASGLLDGLMDALGSLASGASGVARQVVNAIIGFINTQVIGRLNRMFEFTIPLPFVNDIRVNPPDIPGIPMLAEGGIVRSPTLAMIGEAGPEAVVPLNRGGGAAGIGTTMNVTVNMPAGSDGRDVVRALENFNRRRGSLPITTTQNALRR